MTPGDLFGRGAEQDHGVGSVEAALRPEREFALARPQFDLERAQRQAQRLDTPTDRLERAFDLIEAAFGEILIALIKQAHVRGARRPGGIFRCEPRVLDLEQMKFHFKPGEIIEACGL